MESKSTVITEFEIDPNCLAQYTSLPLPDFAIRALEQNGFAYDQKSGNNGESKLSSKQNSELLKLSSHIRHISKHINHDGPIIRPDRAGGF